MTTTASIRPGPLSWRRIVVLLCLGWISIWIYRTTLAPVYGEMRAAFGITSDARVGAIASIYFLSYTAMQIPAGFLVDRFGAKNILIPGFALFALAVGIMGSASCIETVYLGSLLAGLATGSYYGSAYALSGQTVPATHRTLANAVINSGGAAGMAVGLIGSSWLVKELGLPWNSMLYVTCGVICLVGLSFVIFVKPDARTRDRGDGEAAPEAASGTTGLFSLRSISTYALCFSMCYGYYMLVAWLPNFLETERGFTGLAIGMSAALVAFAALPGALLFSRLADVFRARRLSFIIGLQVCSALTLMLIVAAPVPGLLLAGLVLYGLTGKLAVEPMMLSHVIEGAPAQRLGMYLATFNFFGMSASVLAPLITGLISDTLHSKTLAFFIPVALLLGSILFFLFANRKTGSETRHS